MTMWSWLQEREKSAGRMLATCAGAFRPLRHLWPWLVSAIVFGLFLDSSQGRALATGHALEPLPAFAVAFAVYLAFPVTLLPCLFTSIAVKSAVDDFGPGDEARARRRFVETLLHVAWALALTSAPIAMFALAARSAVAGYVLLCLLAVAAAITWLCLRSIRNRDNRWERAMRGLNRHRIFVAVLSLALAVVPLGIGAQAVISQPASLAAYGPLLVALIGLSSLASFVGGLFVAVPACLKRPWLGGVFAAVTLASIWFQPLRLDAPNPLLKEQKEAAAAAAVARGCVRPEDDRAILIHEVLQPKLRKAPAGEEPAINLSPYYLVSADGGGIRAAYWTGVGLAELDEVSNSRFGPRVAFLSGVSGGSLGIAAWLGARELPNLNASQRRGIVEDFLSGDFLSPLLGGFFFLDAPRLVFGQVWFKPHRDHVFEKALADKWSAVTGGSDFFVRPLGNLCLGSFGVPPILTLNAMDALTGQPLRLQSVGSGVPRNMSVVEAVHMSARFPLLSPGAEVREDWATLRQQVGFYWLGRAGKAEGDLDRAKEKVARLLAPFEPDGPSIRRAVIVDGGYFDNSGLVAINDVQGSVKLASAPGVRTRILHFSNSPVLSGRALSLQARNCEPASDKILRDMSKEVMDVANLLPENYRCLQTLTALEQRMNPRPWQWLTTPFEAMLAAREMRSAKEVDRGVDVRMSFADELVRTFGDRAVLPDARLGNAHRTYQRGIDYLKAREDDLRKHPDRNGELALIPPQRQAWGAYLAHSLPIEQRALSCAKTVGLSTPPLSWTLNKNDRALLSCMSTSAALRTSLLQPELPGRDAP